MDPRLQALTAQHGVFLRKEAIALGYDDRAIHRHLSDGTWHRVRRGAYVDGELWRSSPLATQRLLLARAVLRNSRCHAFLSHQSAAHALGADVWQPPELAHLTRSDGRAGRREAGVVQHRGVLRVGDTTVRDGIPVTSGTRTALDVASVSDVEHSLVVVNSLLHLGETTKPLLTQGLATQDCWPRTLHNDLVVRLADGRLESVGESRAYFLCWAQGLPAPQPQFEVKDRSGNIVARLDFAWPQRRVWMEFDGRQKYVKYLRPGETVADAVAREKRREDQIRELTGWLCIRICWADLYTPELTAARVRAMLDGPVAA